MKPFYDTFWFKCLLVAAAILITICVLATCGGVR